MKIIEICKVAPPPELTSPDTMVPKILPLTFFDLLWLRFPPVHRLFYYHLSPSESLVFFDSILPKLKMSLSLTLRRFLPLAGKITWHQDFEKPVMIYEVGDAVSFTVAQSEADFRHFSEFELSEATECHFLIPELEDSDEKASVIALQLTFFPNSGFCIGIASHHAALDGKSSTSFMKSWACVCKIGEEESFPPELNPFYDRTIIKDSGGLGEIYVNDWLNQGGIVNKSLKYLRFEVPPNSIRGTFEISGQNLEKLRASMASKLNRRENYPVHITKFSLTCAYIWVCIAKAEQNAESCFIFTVDCRSRLRPAVPPSYVGNCVIGRPVKAKTEDLSGENGVAMAMELISKEMADLRKENGLLEGAAGFGTRVSSSNKGRTSRLIGAGGSPRFEVYVTDFGWGRPRKVEMTSIDKTGAICLSEGRDEDGGIQIGLVLNVRAMEAFASFFKQGLEAI